MTRESRYVISRLVRTFNDGWFRCDRCGAMKKVLVKDDVRVLSSNCSCGGTFRKT